MDAVRAAVGEGTDGTAGGTLVPRYVLIVIAPLIVSM
jgi:hypothetical protein